MMKKTEEEVIAETEGDGNSRDRKEDGEKIRI